MQTRGGVATLAIGLVVLFVFVLWVTRPAAIALLGGCGGPAYEWRIIVQEDNGDMWSAVGQEKPCPHRGCYVVGDETSTQWVPVEKAEVKRIQVGPHQCECGGILRTYRDRCRGCGRMILMGRRTPPDDEA